MNRMYEILANAGWWWAGIVFAVIAWRWFRARGRVS